MSIYSDIGYFFYLKTQRVTFYSRKLMSTKAFITDSKKRKFNTNFTTMKKSIAKIITVLVIALSFTTIGCKKDKKTDPEPTPIVVIPPTPLGITSPTSSAITGARVTLTSNVTGDGGLPILERGFFGGNTPSQTLQGSNKIVVSGGTGSFVKNYNGLYPNITYYIKSYVRNATDTAYGAEITFTTTDLEYGDFYAGGYVFYLDGSLLRGLVADSLDLSQSLITGGGVSTFGGLVSGTSTNFGTGQANTTAFVNYCTTNNYGLTQNAIGNCNSLDVRGHNDWYLPSYGELELMYSNLKVNGFGNFSNLIYWSSTASPGNPTNNIDCIDFTNGILYLKFQSNNYNGAARAVRTF